MMTPSEFTHKATSMSKAAARYEQLHKAMKWLDDGEKTHDIKPTFWGHNGSACAGFAELIELLNELGQNRMKELIAEVKKLAWEQIREIDKKHG
ncbi:MAG: hypothetical protein EOR34_10780 [Mesorhizobium sp.]|uniref:hypothetical protein n=1 Tax=Mesorhizobium sp. TaxID=1871066 RepID=UPI000FE4B417|nr:hypothetical protein [Mesorhizobium sp.]RWI48374.1 MAG: hypothetical protein EOR15_13510 [Mesorhizobium sp.]RWI88125.1 MAG: hypothetical protein EOR20_03565 [Mesorhizobium sp.]RWJ60117.1 MAG: hypothetical protein EOR32_19700 [Mesorhizobium sp.]RWJ74367.1 MAG: hypothetical protein EOR34_10780 [Mesorhizobium sp.]